MDPNTSGLSGGISGHHENPPQRPPRNQDFLALRSMIENGINFLNDSFSRQFTELSEKISAMSNTGNHNHDGRNAGSVVGYEVGSVSFSKTTIFVNSLWVYTREP